MKKRDSKKGDQAASLPLHEIVALAAYLAGADRKPIDTEDIAIKANEVAPGHFSWRKYKNQIRLDFIYKHLWDLTKKEKGEYVTGSEKDGWLLTPAGLAFAERTTARLKNLKPVRKLSREEESWSRRERNRMLGEVAFQKVSTGKEAEITKSEAEKFFRLDDYVVGAARARKLQYCESMFHDDPELAPVISKVASIVRGGV